MDPINTKLLRQLIRTLERIEDRSGSPLAHENYTGPEREQPTKDKDQQQIFVEVRSELGLPVAVREYYEAEQRQRYSAWQKIKTGLEIVGVASAVSLAVLTYLTLNRIGSQADSARKQVGIMQKQLEATDRPWIEITNAAITTNAYIVKIPEHEHPDMTMSIHIRGKNVGRSVAQNVRLKSDMVFRRPSDSDEEALRAQTGVCATTDAVNITPKLTLFPNQETGEGRLHSEFWSAISSAAINPHGRHPATLQPLVVGCIVYDIPGAFDNPHHTGFIYEVEPEVGRDIEIPFQIVFALGKVFPGSHLRLRELEGFSNTN